MEVQVNFGCGGLARGAEEAASNKVQGLGRFVGSAIASRSDAGRSPQLPLMDLTSLPSHYSHSRISSTFHDAKPLF